MPEEGINLFPVDSILTFEDILFFVETVSKLGVNKIRITGGEPLIRKNVQYLIKSINNLENIKDVGLTTNGVLLDEYIDELIDAGLKRINISLDTLKRDKFKFITRRDFYENVIRGIKVSVKKGLNPVKLNIVAIKNFNDDEVIDFVRFGIDNNVQIRFIEFMPFGEFHNLRFISKKEIIDKIETVYKLILAENKDIHSPAQIYKIEGTDTTVGFISPLTEHFCNRCNRIRLTCNGTLKTCLFSDTVYDIFKTIKRGEKDILRNELLKIINEKPEKHHIKLSDYKFKKCQNEMRTIGG
jgi:cyclic pyranopterin phosphate synthase